MEKNLILKLFEGFSIERWNDLVRPFEIVEMDKAAEKMAVAYIIGKFEENRGAKIDWEWIIYASLFDLLQRIALCDIKSPVRTMIKAEYPLEYIRLNEWVLSRYKNLICDEDLFSRFTMYIGQTSASLPIYDEKIALSAKVLRAAHKFSSYRELEMISCVNEEKRIQKIKSELENDLEDFLDLEGARLLMTHRKPFDFVMIFEQLRFQTRWNQTPRVPRTSVLGHSFYVAILTLLLMRESGTEKFCEERLYNNFFCALFHDLPEAVTRDIISPVKRATDALPSVVKNIEKEIVKKELVPLTEKFYADELLYFMNDEFENRIIEKKEVKIVTFEELNQKYNQKKFSPVDGEIIKIADRLSALVEAERSIQHGISSEHLILGKENLLDSYKEQKIVSGINANEIFLKFR